jgi:calcineurin-like phosphoesterase family protein
MRVWPHSGRGAWQLYGHSHGNLPDDPLSLSMDVGVDSHGFCPWHFEEVQAIMKGKSIAGKQSPETNHSDREKK